MSQVYRVVWSKSAGTLIAVSELDESQAKGEGARRCKQAVSLVLLIAVSLNSTSWASDKYREPNNTGVGFGGTGTWSTISTFWSPNSDGVSGPYSDWNNAALDDVFFGSTAGPAMDEPIAVHNLNFLVDAYTLSGNTLTLASVAYAVSGGTGSATINPVISGTTSPTEVGADTLLLNGANTFTGDINVNSGRLANMANDSQLAVGPIGDALPGQMGPLTRGVCVCDVGEAIAVGVSAG